MPDDSGLSVIKLNLRLDPFSEETGQQSPGPKVPQDEGRRLVCGGRGGGPQGAAGREAGRICAQLHDCAGGLLHTREDWKVSLVWFFGFYFFLGMHRSIQNK